MGRTIINIKVEDVEKRRQPNKHYVYVICVSWSDQAVTVIYRRYSQFFSLQNKLLDKFPVEGGDWDPAERIIPFLPGKILFGRSHIRRVALDRLEMIGQYCTSLVQLPEHISESKEVLEFFETHPEDIRQYEKEKSPVRQGPVASKITNPLLLEQYVAVDDYTTEGPNETSLTAGALVEVVEKAETGWWFVSTEDGRGWVPSSYLETYNGEKEDRILQKANQGHGEKFICYQSYQARQPDELSMEKGAYVEVLERNLDGWWLVRINDKEGRVPGTFLTRTDTLRAKRLIDVKCQPKVEIISNVMAISNLSKKPKDTIPVASKANAAFVGDNKTKPTPPASSITTNKPVNKPVVFMEPQQPRPVQLRNPPAPTTASDTNLGPPTASMRSLAMSSESIYSWNSTWSEESEAGPSRVPPRRDEVEVRHRTPSMTEDCLYEVHTGYVSDIHDGLTVEPGQVLKLLERAHNGWWFFQSETDEGWAPSAYVQQIGGVPPKPKTKPQRPPPPKLPRNPQCPPVPDVGTVDSSDRFYGNIDEIDTSYSDDTEPVPPVTPQPNASYTPIPAKFFNRSPTPPQTSNGTSSDFKENLKNIIAPPTQDNPPKPPKSPKPAPPVKPAGLKPILAKKPPLAVKPKLPNTEEQNSVKVQKLKSQFE